MLLVIIIFAIAWLIVGLIVMINLRLQEAALNQLCKELGEEPLPNWRWWDFPLSCAYNMVGWLGALQDINMILDEIQVLERQRSGSRAGRG